MERKIKEKKMHQMANGHFWPKHYEAHFGHHCQEFSKSSIQIFLFRSLEHMKVSSLVFANLASLLSTACIKIPKWECLFRFKITQFWDFDQTNITLQTKGTGWCYLIWASHPWKIFEKFKKFCLAAIWSSSLQAEERIVPMLADFVDLVQPWPPLALSEP